MKSFNLEEALKGEAVITREGTPIIEIFKMKTVADYPVLVVNRDGFPRCYTEQGKYYLDDDENPEDLFMAPEFKTMWANVYRRHDGELEILQVWEDEGACKGAISPTRNFVKTISFEVEEK